MKPDYQKHSKWYEKAFGELYPVFYSHRDEDSAAAEITDLFRNLKITRKIRILDLCCGTGRHLLPIVQKGFNAIGLDLSPQLLKTANKKKELSSRLLRGDIRRIPFKSSFELVLNLFSSFGYFQSDIENEYALSEMSRILIPGGTIVMDHMNRQKIEQSLVPRDIVKHKNGTLEQQRWINNNRVCKKLTWTGLSGESYEFTEDVRMYKLEELVDLFERNHLKTLQTLGSFKGEPFSSESSRMIILAQKEIL